MTVTPPPNFGKFPTRVHDLGARQQQAQLQQQQAHLQVQAAMNQLSMQIYIRLVTRDHAIPGYEDWCRHKAKLAQLAARCYFEGIGVIEKEEKDAETTNQDG